MGTNKILQRLLPSNALERSAYTVPEFCFRNHLSRSAYQRLPVKPAEMRIGLNIIRITAEAEREWQLAMQEPNAELEQQAFERAVKAGEAAAKSPNHVSKQGPRLGPTLEAALAERPKIRKPKTAQRDAEAAGITDSDCERPAPPHHIKRRAITEAPT